MVRLTSAGAALGTTAFCNDAMLGNVLGYVLRMGTCGREIARRGWIEKWILEKSPEVRPRQGTGVLSPMGHGILSHTRLVSNQTVRRLANQWRERNVKVD